MRSGSRPRLDSFRRLSTTLVKFRRKGGFRSGISLGEAMANVRLSGNDSYTFHDLNVDPRGRVILKVKVSTACGARTGRWCSSFYFFFCFAVGSGRGTRR